MNATVVQGDALHLSGALADDSIDAIVTDPPYGLSFMGKEWDHGVPGAPFWSEFIRTMKPGAHLLAFGGTRTHHRLMVAIEDAGFEIRDCLMWLYGSGMPKGRNLKDGWDGWGTTLKPGWEPIIMARKPLAGTVAANVLQHGTGGLNVDGCRIAFQSESDRSESEGKNQHTRYKNPGSNRDSYSGKYPPRTNYNGGMGRWPANVLLDEGAAELLDDQVGNRKAGSPKTGNEPKAAAFSGNLYGDSAALGQSFAGYGDDGGPSRFFYTAKASRSERNAGLNGMPNRKKSSDGYGSIQRPILDRSAPRENWEPHETPNNHPTVKPIALMRWLCRLVTPPGGTILDPFNGSGTTGCAAVLEGFRYLGFELEQDYVEISERRITHWAIQQ